MLGTEFVELDHSILLFLTDVLQTTEHVELETSGMDQTVLEETTDVTQETTGIQVQAFVEEEVILDHVMLVSTLTMAKEAVLEELDLLIDLVEREADIHQVLIDVLFIEITDQLELLDQQEEDQLLLEQELDRLILE